MSVDSLNSDHSFSRPNPYFSIGNSYGKPAREVLIELGKKLESGQVTDEELVQFFGAHRLVFINDKTGMASSWWFEQSNSYSKATFACVRSCSCECGPLSNPCNELGPGSKTVDFSFKKEETK